MSLPLATGRAGAPKGEAEALVIFLHGYGANGADLLGLAEPLAPHLPGAAFLAPDAPSACAGVPGGYQWFPIPWIDGSSEADSLAGMAQAVGRLDAFLDAVAEDEGIAAASTVLLGFSQGTMMALHVAPRRPEPVAAVVGFSGRLLLAERLAGEARVRPPILLLHGDADEVVPPAALPEAGQALDAAGFDVQGYVMRGTGHGIAPDGLGAALHFIRARLGLDTAAPAP